MCYVLINVTVKTLGLKTRLAYSRQLCGYWIVQPRASPKSVERVLCVEHHRELFRGACRVILHGQDRYPGCGPCGNPARMQRGSTTFDPRRETKFPAPVRKKLQPPRRCRLPKRILYGFRVRCESCARSQMRSRRYHANFIML